MKTIPFYASLLFLLIFASCASVPKVGTATVQIATLTVAIDQGVKMVERGDLERLRKAIDNLDLTPEEVYFQEPARRDWDRFFKEMKSLQGVSGVVSVASLCTWRDTLSKTTSPYLTILAKRSPELPPIERLILGDLVDDWTIGNKVLLDLCSQEVVSGVDIDGLSKIVALGAMFVDIWVKKEN